MLRHPTIATLQTLKLTGMATALAEQLEMPEVQHLSFEARLGRLGPRLVLDVRPAARESEPALTEAAMLIRGHVLFVIDIAADSVRIAMLKPEALRSALMNKSVQMAHVDDRDRLVLTGTSEELRRVLAGYMERSGALDEPGTWRKER